MASALLASRNEPCWGERKVYMRKTPNSNPNQKVDPKPDRQFHDPSSQINWRHANKPPAAAPAGSDFSSSLNHKSINVNNPKDSSPGGYLTFNIGEYSRRELRELKKRLISELEQVRNLSNRIDLREIQSRSGYSASQFSGSYGGREGISATRPPPLQLNYYPSDSPGDDGLNEKRTPKANQYYRPSEFVTGKERMPSDNKKVSGSKRPPPFLPGMAGKDMKRVASDPETGKQMKRCRQILTMLMKHKHSWIFNVPVDVVGMGLHDYNQIIKRPMDLGTVKLKLGKNLYASPNDFASDVRLTFNNALIYNPRGHDVYVMAEQLLARFEEMFEPAHKKNENAKEARRSSSIPMPTPESEKKPYPVPGSKNRDSVLARAPVPSKPLAPPSDVKQLTTTRLATGGKQPKPKAKDPNKREMSFMEKQKLGMNLQNLPQEKMELVVQIIRKRNGHLAQDGDEIELDIEALDKETLWVLDRFVNNIKKMMSKTKRQSSLTSNPSSAVEGNNMVKAFVICRIPFETHEAAAAKNKKVETGEEDVDIGDEIPMNNFPPVEIEKDAGYASSSSGSSSSDSSSSSGMENCLFLPLGIKGNVAGRLNLGLSAGSDSGSSSGSDTDAEDAQSAKRFPMELGGGGVMDEDHISIG
ncbi:hypothetical protein HHK36_009648 [Tetracentron sinense]|uniref:Uncharacterized protein n=1 Tax=Tetracentron sinense TaxID=13715 RepID=A0A834ZC38_TETSI|nr:hypothetical protein HHK36_009648 [Tetracentron sinense]